MPMISAKVSDQLSSKDKKQLRQELIAAVASVSGKGEDWMMVEVQDHVPLYYRGEEAHVGFLEIKLVGTLTAQQKQEITGKTAQAIGRIGIPRDRLYMVFTEVSGENWGWNGTTFA